jgi:uncharacterized protein
MLVNKDWLLTPERALVHLATATAIVADMHLGYCEARQVAGEAVPIADIHDTVSIFRHLRARHKILRVVVAGDLIENRAGLEVASRFHRCLKDLGLELTVVPGNHDRGVEAVGLPIQKRITIGGWRIVHGFGPLPRGRAILGHYHPALRIDGRHLPCFLIGRRRMILPAFSDDATGGQVASRRRRMNTGASRSPDRDATVSGRDATRGNTDAADWQAIAIVGNRLFAAQTENNTGPVKARSVWSQA